MYNPFSLEGKQIFITGASSGIGRAIAIECSKLAGDIFITGRDKNRLLNTYNSLTPSSNHHHFPADLTKESELNELIDNLPLLDGVVFNAGVVKDLLVRLSDKKDVDKIFSINTFAPIYLTQLLLQKKKIKKNGSILFITSISGTSCGYIGGSIYGSSKAALLGFIKALALEVAPRNIRVNSISPGMVETDLLNGTSLSDEQINLDKDKYPLRRYGTPEDIAYAAVYLLSNTSRWMTGSNIIIDGGYTLK